MTGPWSVFATSSHSLLCCLHFSPGAGLVFFCSKWCFPCSGEHSLYLQPLSSVTSSGSLLRCTFSRKLWWTTEAWIGYPWKASPLYFIVTFMILYNYLLGFFSHKTLRYMKADTVLFNQVFAQRILHK